jgi:hypothetical protein
VCGACVGACGRGEGLKVTVRLRKDGRESARRCVTTVPSISALIYVSFGAKLHPTRRAKEFPRAETSADEEIPERPRECIVVVDGIGQTLLDPLIGFYSLYPFCSLLT